MKPTNYPAKGKDRGKKIKKSGEKRKQKVKGKNAVSLLNTTISKFCFLHMPELRKLIFGI